MVRRYAAILLIAGCTSAPVIEGAPPVGRAQDAPALIPVGTVLNQGRALAGARSPDLALSARVAALRTRAARLRAR